MSFFTARVFVIRSRPGIPQYLDRLFDDIVRRAERNVPGLSSLHVEAFWLYQATSQTPALKRFERADEQGAHFDTDNQRVWPKMLVNIQQINELGAKTG